MDDLSARPALAHKFASRRGGGGLRTRGNTHQTKLNRERRTGCDEHVQANLRAARGRTALIVLSATEDSILASKNVPIMDDQTTLAAP